MISKNLDKPNWNIIPKILKYSLPMVPSDIFYSLGTNLDKLILSKFINYNDLGIYSVSTKIAKVILEVNGSIKNAWIPLLMWQIT